MDYGYKDDSDEEVVGKKPKVDVYIFCKVKKDEK